MVMIISRLRDRCTRNDNNVQNIWLSKYKMLWKPSDHRNVCSVVQKIILRVLKACCNFSGKWKPRLNLKSWGWGHDSFKYSIWKAGILPTPTSKIMEGWDVI